MAKCKFCGKAVEVAIVYHPACWEKEAEKMAEIFCDHYCRYPLERRSEEEMQELYCGNCPLIRVLNLGL